MNIKNDIFTESRFVMGSANHCLLHKNNNVSKSHQHIVESRVTSYSFYNENVLLLLRPSTIKVNQMLTFKTLIVVYFSRRARQFLSFQHRQQTLMYTNVLLFCLHHPHTLLTHRQHYSKYIHVIRYENLLQYSIQTDERSRSTNTGTKI